MGTILSNKSKSKFMMFCTKELKLGKSGVHASDGKVLPKIQNLLLTIGKEISLIVEYQVQIRPLDWAKWKIRSLKVHSSTKEIENLLKDQQRNLIPNQSAENLRTDINTLLMILVLWQETMKTLKKRSRRLPESIKPKTTPKTLYMNLESLTKPLIARIWVRVETKIEKNLPTFIIYWCLE